MKAEKKLHFEELMHLARESAKVTRSCPCAVDSFQGWTRTPASFPHELMRVAGTLVDDPYAEAPYTEFHPAGTNYWSEQAPIAIHHFPYNRCKVLQCAGCGRCYLAYVEAGGYYVEPRIRALDPSLIVDATCDE